MQNTNQLIHETSPYLLQHAHNPVNWLPWGNEALQKAKDENKPLIVSIGYSACHWCHVMEHESFEDEEVAQLMNQFFVCIKVDREERPDIDHLYMDAAHLINGQGGWPLNCFALPDGRPFFAGTYFRKNQWINLLKQIHTVYISDYQKVKDYARKIEQGIRENSFLHLQNSVDFHIEILDEMVEKWSLHFDNELGGPKRAPKFPLPNNYEFLLRFGVQLKRKDILEHVKLTLDKMAKGGIYDQIGGGFARYSTDIYWKVPHFEKMLYDNAQLIKLYSLAFQYFKNPLYKKVVEETIQFVNRELTSSEGVFYSALDADSEGVEGKFYVWNKNEISEILGKDSELFMDYFSMNEIGFWEEENYILMQTDDENPLCEKYNLTKDELTKLIIQLKDKVLQRRKSRIRPGLDDKTLISWNAMMSDGLITAYKTFGNAEYLNSAEKNIQFILENCSKNEVELFHSYKNGTAKIDGFLEDYAFLIQSLIELFSVTGNSEYVHQAQKFTDFVIHNFFEQKQSLFYFSKKIENTNLPQKIEFHDNVIPSSNSVMANNMFKLARYLGQSKYEEIALSMLNAVGNQMSVYGSGFSNWALLGLNVSRDFFELVISGSEAKSQFTELSKKYLPWTISTYCNEEKEFPDLLLNRFSEDKIQYFVCTNGSCQLPLNSLDEMLQKIEMK